LRILQEITDGGNFFPFDLIPFKNFICDLSSQMSQVFKNSCKI